MSKIMNYLKDSQNNIALSMMSASVMLNGSALDWRLMAQLAEQK